MTDTRCGYQGERGDTLIAYLYDDIGAADRASFDAHLASCDRCRTELDALRGIRVQLGRWTPPQPEFGLVPSRVESHESRVDGRESAVDSLPWWQAIPVWAQVAAAMLVLGVSAGVANVNLHYGADGLTVRTGWSKPAAVAADADGRLKPRATDSDARTTNLATGDPTPWRADLAALERQLCSELQASAAARPLAAHATVSPGNDAELVRRVRALIADSERRQQRELALRIAGVVSDMNVARAADLARVRQTLGALESTTGAELFKQRQQMVNYLSQVSLKR